MKRPAQICPHNPGAFRRWYKRLAYRAMRRLGKRLLDDAPQRVGWRGYST